MLRLAREVESSAVLDLGSLLSGRLPASVFGDELPSLRPRPSVDPATFRELFGGHPAGVSVVTTLSRQGAPIGLTVSAVMSLSLEPPQLGVALENRKYTLRAIEERGEFAVNFLAAEQTELSGRFARPGGDKFADTGWRPSDLLGLPWLSGTRAAAECVVDRLVRCGDHTMVVGHVASAAVTAETTALAYCDRTYGQVSAAGSQPSASGAA